MVCKKEAAKPKPMVLTTSELASELEDLHGLMLDLTDQMTTLLHDQAPDFIYKEARDSWLTKLASALQDHDYGDDGVYRGLEVTIKKLEKYDDEEEQ